MSESQDPNFWSKTSWIQLGYGILVNLSLTGIGLAFGFAAVALPQLTQPESLFHVTKADQSWIASCVTLSSPVGCILSGYLLDNIGRKAVLILSEVPISIGWLYTGFASSSLHIVIGRIITGVGCGMLMAVPRVYCAEITRPSMRGVVGCLSNLAISGGITAQAAFGSFLHWRTLSFLACSYTVFVMMLQLFLPETPYFVLMKKTEEDARNTLKRFRSSKYDVDTELRSLMTFKKTYNIRSLTFREKMRTLLEKSSYKPFLIVIVYVIFMQFSGVTIIIIWATDLLQRSNSSIDMYLGNVILGITRFLATFLTAFLLYRLGRRSLALSSGFGIAVIYIFLGIFIITVNKPTVIPMICYVLYIICATLGYYTIPFLIMFEIFPLQIRGFLGGITICMTNILIFTVNMLYPYVRDAIGFSYTIISIGTVSLIGGIYLYFFLPETKGLTLHEIEDYFKGSRLRLNRPLNIDHPTGNSKVTPTSSKPGEGSV